MLSTTAPADVPRRKHINRGGRPPQPGSHPLRIWRLANDFTVAGLGALAGLSSATVSRIENGRQTPSLAMVKRLIKASGGALAAGDFL
jgi:DNA-binding XRE family transcriptional regulator